MSDWETHCLCSQARAWGKLEPLPCPRSPWGPWLVMVCGRTLLLFSAVTGCLEPARDAWSLGVPPPGPTPHCPLPALMAVSGSAELSTEKSISQSPGASLGQQGGIRISIPPPPTWNARVPQGHSQDLSPSVHSPGDTETSQKGHNSGSGAEQDILLPATPGVGGSGQRRAVGLCVQALHA